MSSAHTHLFHEESKTVLAELAQALRDWDALTAGLPHRERDPNPDDQPAAGFHASPGSGPGA